MSLPTPSTPLDQRDPKNLPSVGKRKGLFPSSYAAWRPLGCGVAGCGKGGSEHTRRPCTGPLAGLFALLLASGRDGSFDIA
jgi:hypothetical protein